MSVEKSNLQSLSVYLCHVSAVEITELTDPNSCLVDIFPTLHSSLFRHGLRKTVAH